MVTALLIACFLLALAGVISKVFISRRLEEGKERLADAQLEAQRSSAHRRQNEDLLSFEKDKEHRLKSERQALIDQLKRLKNRLGGPSPG